MFKTIFSYEIKYWLRNPSLYFYIGSVLFLSTGMMAGISGVFDEESVSAGRLSNSPMSLFSLFNTFNKLILFLLPAVIGHSIYRDFKSNAHSLLYSYPFTKREYLAGKFLSSFLNMCLIASMIALGFIIGTHLPGANNSLIVPFNAAVYLQIYFIYLLPDIFLFGVFVFAIVVFSRNIYAGFISVIILLILREAVLKLTGGADSGIAFLLMDPFCETATYFYAKNITASETDLMSIPFGALIIFNRLLWLAVSLVILFIVYKKFSFSNNPFSFKFRNLSSERITKNNFGSIIKIHLPKVSYRFDFTEQLRVAWKLSSVNFKYIISSGSFISILIAGSLFVFIILLQMNPQYETRILPVTWVMLAFPVFFFSMLICLMTFLYSGVLIHRDKSSRINELVDITPAPNWVLLLSKFLALVKMQVLMLLVLMTAGITVQIYSGYYNFEIGHYLFDLFVIHLTGFVIWTFAALFIQSLIPNQYLSLIILTAGYFLIPQLPQLGIEKLIFRFNQNPEPDFYLKYSDPSGHGHSLIPYFTYKVYWILFGLCLFFATLLAWQRGLSNSFKDRMVTAMSRLKGITGFGLLVSFILFFSAGIWIHTMEITDERIFSDKELEKIISESDEKYSKYRRTVQPRITSVNVNIDIFPGSQSFTSNGVSSIVNRSNQIIDTLLINYGFNVNTKYSLDKDYKVISRDTISHFDILLLNQGLNPGDSMKLFFEVESIPNTLLHKNSPVEKNGTFITSEICPGLGYYSSDSYPDATDSSALKNHYRSVDSDFIEFETTVSTDSDQTAIAPGYLTKDWTENGRRYFKYNSDGKVTNDYAFISGEYEIKKDKWNDVTLEIYYYKGHEYNLEHLMNGLKAGLEYNENNFSPYQHRQARLIEYSRTQGNFAMSFANTIPYSESNFILDIDDSEEDGLNLPFLGAVHELTHQWWGHQVIPANVDGVRMITESMAEYVSLKTLEHKYGKAKVNKFLKKARDIYLNKRALDTDIEKPLMYNEGLSKSYIPYQKGSIVLYAMSEYIGEENLNKALKKYLEKVKFQEAPYTTSSETVDFIREVTPDSLKYLIKDMFETVTFYDNKITDAKTVKLPDGKYKTDIEFEISKYRIDERGDKIYEDKPGQAINYSAGENDKQSLPLRDYIEICLYSQNDSKQESNEEAVYTGMHRAEQLHNVVSIITDEKPSTAVIDPFIFLIDMNVSDNSMPVSE